jgi:hypothetical protein
MRMKKFLIFLRHPREVLFLINATSGNRKIAYIGRVNGTHNAVVVNHTERIGRWL